MFRKQVQFTPSYGLLSEKMKKTAPIHHLLGTLQLILAMGLVGCGDDEITPGPASSSCPNGQALVGVSDGALTALCGCSETRTTVLAPNLFTCTVSSPVHVTFQLLGTGLEHQIVFDGGTVPSSPLLEPGEVPTHSVFISSSGSYTFSDRGSNGRIVAQ